MLTRRLLVSVVALLAATATAPGPAGAVPRGAARLSFPAEVTLPLTFDAKRVSIFMGVPDNLPPPPLVDSRLTLDLADLVGVATVTTESFGWTCEKSGTTLACVTNGWFPGVIDLGIAPAPQAVEGDIGQMPITFTVPGLKPASGSMTIRTVSIVDLVDASGWTTDSGVPGDDITWPVRVRNAGQVTVDGVVAIFIRPHRLRFHERHGNCEYALGFYGRAEYAACRFDAAEIPPGATFEVSPVPPMRVAVDASGGRPVAVVRWLTSFDWAKEREQWANNSHGFTPGAGPPLRLVEAAGLRAGSQTESDRTNNSGSVSVTVNAGATADVAAMPATITGRVGEFVTMRLGNHNYGPTSVDWSDPQDEPAVFLQVKVPPGVTVTASERRCRPTQPETPDGHFEPGAAEYVCGDGSVHPVGETIWFELTFRIDRKVAGAEGRLAIRGFPDLPAVPWSSDPNPSNDTAPLKVRVLGGDSGGGSAGGLPITGAGTGTVGVGLLVVGVFLVLVARRRASTGAGS
jgi:hypothetical protein